jgi:hypothetical protein
MSQGLLLDELPPDLACAIALGIVEDPCVIVSLEAVTLQDTRQQPIGTQSGWLNPDDPLHAVTREYLKARREVTMLGARRPGSAWSSAHAHKVREAANTRAIQAKIRGRMFLAERGVLDQARAAGLTVLG